MRASPFLHCLVAALVLAGTSGIARADYVTTLTGMSGLVSYWNLNEAEGTTAADLITSDLVDGNNVGTYTGTGVTLGVAGPGPSDGFLGFSAGNKAASFSDDKNTKLQMAVHSVYEGQKDLSLVTWLKFPSIPTSSSDRRAVGGLQRIASNRYTFATALYNPTPDGLQGFVRRSDGVTETSWTFERQPSTINTWHMWVLTIANGQVVKCYLDGDLKEEHDFGDSAGLATIGGLIFGNDIDVSANRPWKGELDEIAMFNRAISESEVAGLYTAAAIPEPSTLVLLVLGALGLLALRRR